MNNITEKRFSNLKIRSKFKVFLFLSICFSIPITSNAQWQQIGGNIEGDMTYEYFGRAMALSPDGTTVAIGSQANPENLFFSIVRVLKEDAGVWHQVGSDIEAPDGDNSDAISLSKDGPKFREVSRKSVNEISRNFVFKFREISRNLV